MELANNSFIEYLRKKYMEFDNRLSRIESLIYQDSNNKLRIFVFDLINLLRNVTYLLNKLSTPTADFDANAILIIPINPYYERLEPPIPQPGYYDNKITIYNLSTVVEEYMRYYPSNSGDKTILTRIAYLFNFLISGGETTATENYFLARIENLNERIKNSNLSNIIDSENRAARMCNRDDQAENIPIIDLIQTWKDIIRYILKLQNRYNAEIFENDDGTIIVPGPKLEIPDNINERTIFVFLRQPFFNDQRGGVNINGEILQKVIIIHYNNVYNKIIRQISALFDDVKEKIERATEALLPFDVSKLSDLANLNQIKKLFGNEDELLQLLDNISYLIQKIYNYYKIVINIPSSVSDPFVSNYINSNYNTPAILTVDYLERKATIVVLNGVTSVIEKSIKNNLLNNMNCEDDNPEYGVYDYLTGINNFSARERIQAFIYVIKGIKARSADNINEKDDITERLEAAFRALTESYVRRRSNDIKLDISSTYSSDYSLLDAYNKYLLDIASIRRTIKNKIREIDELFETEKEIFDEFYDTYVGSSYYKIIMANKWLLTNDDYGDKKPHYHLR